MIENTERKQVRKTKAREEILLILSNSHYPMTVEEIHSAMKHSSADISTVYRCLNSFCANGMARKEVNQNKENVFSLANNKDVHYVVCVKCHKKIILQDCPYHEVNEQLEKETGFVISDHNTEIYGVCPDCQKSKAK